ncbi:MAG TPA: ATP-binding protein [Solirubrobacteraceae bacterium]|jgi:anti-sigma regulatory factor (Ser/Thr protein kinase)
MTEVRRFPCRPESVTAARRFVRDRLRDESADIVEAAELMTSELASNCIRHAHTEFELSIGLREGIRVEVRDMGDGRPVMRSPSPAEPSGRGLRIVEAMASTWGVSPSPSGKVVWFTLASPAPAAREERGAAVANDAGAARGSSSPGIDRASADASRNAGACRRVGAWWRMGARLSRNLVAWPPLRRARPRPA